VKRGVILDRDGTLIDVVRDEETGVITTAFHPKQLRLLPGVVEGLGLLRDAGYVLAIATNQPGPAKGQITAASVEATNTALAELLAREGVTVAKVAVCMHHPDGGPGGDPALVGPCACRKPKPGMLRDLARDLDLDLARSWMVGDTTSDVEAGRAAGARTALLFDTKRCELCPLREGTTAKPDLHAATFLALARQIVDA
jgi:D-glycero-D-manno-heptose 1,7-bisphosphate phosphatase